MLINCDMGESFGTWTIGQDAQIMPFIDMANIACAMHASDPTVMRKTVQLAKQHKVKIGAHPGYADLQGFGRRHISMSREDLSALYIYQLGALQGICRCEGTQIEYVKPHGALYNDMMRDDAIFQTLLQAQAHYDASLPLMIMAVPDKQRYVDMAAEFNIALIFEAFSDRSYLDDGRLTPRSAANSQHHTLSAVIDQVTRLATQGEVISNTGTHVAIEADSVCIHGDGPLALQIATQLRERLQP